MEIPIQKDQDIVGADIVAIAIDDAKPVTIAIDRNARMTFSLSSCRVEAAGAGIRPPKKASFSPWIWSKVQRVVLKMTVRG